MAEDKAQGGQHGASTALAGAKLYHPAHLLNETCPFWALGDRCTSLGRKLRVREPQELTG